MVKHLILFILIFSFMACDKDDGNLIPDIYTGTASATINGEEWNSLTYFDEINSSKNPSLFILRMDRYNNAGIQIESFNIRRIQASFEVQEITSTDNQNELGLLSAG
ncbi:MAG: hypothetical protein IIC74_08810 [Bacteroidetes bacterium]|nr:hypothetical protein [Bacteroidota bacterium]